jgi:hypothetical protein
MWDSIDCLPVSSDKELVPIAARKAYNLADAMLEARKPQTIG